jgi:chemotaxis signal transduction protein
MEFSDWMTERYEGNNNPRKYITLRLGERKFAIDLNPVQEIFVNPEVSPMSLGGGKFIGTLENSRGNIPVLDLLGRPADIDSIRKKILIVIGYPALGILADELYEYISVEPSSALPIPDGAYGIDFELLKGIVESDGENYYLIDLERVASGWQAGKPIAGRTAIVPDENEKEN